MCSPQGMCVAGERCHPQGAVLHRAPSGTSAPRVWTVAAVGCMSTASPAVSTRTRWGLGQCVGGGGMCVCVRTCVCACLCVHALVFCHHAHFNPERHVPTASVQHGNSFYNHNVQLKFFIQKLWRHLFAMTATNQTCTGNEGRGTPDFLL